MSNKLNTILLVILCIITIFCTYKVCYIIYNQPSYSPTYNHVVDKEIFFSLPEDLKDIEETDKLRAFYKDGVIVITYDKDLQTDPIFIWNDDIEAIPEDGSTIIIEQSIGGLHYIGTVEANK